MYFATYLFNSSLDLPSIDNLPNLVYNNIRKEGTEHKKTEGTAMKEYTMRKSVEGYWYLLITNEDGTVNDYRFTSKRELTAWMKMAGLK